MKLEFKKRRRSILENIFIYPSFSLRFWFYTGILAVLFITIIIFIIPKISTWANRLSGINIALQSVTLIFGVIAAYFALKQLTESRFSKLDEVGMQNLKGKRYFRAINAWREALYIRPDGSVFFNLLETFLISEQFDEFDKFVGYLEKRRSFQQAVITEPHDYIIFCYLQAIRSLIVENMGVAKERLNELIVFMKEHEPQANIGWDFDDIKNSTSYDKLTGDHKNVADNLIKYLTKQLTPEEKVKFENKKYLLS